MKNLKTLLVVGIVLLVIIIILQNTRAVETKLLFMTITMPRALLLILTFLVGFVGGVFFLNYFQTDPQNPMKSDVVVNKTDETD